MPVHHDEDLAERGRLTSHLVTPVVSAAVAAFQRRRACRRHLQQHRTGPRANRARELQLVRRARRARQLTAGLTRVLAAHYMSYDSVRLPRMVLVRVV
jgi:hypothetical protein